MERYIPNVSRRTILRGLGAALTLPWLESLARAQGDKTGPPRRWAAMIFANGVNEKHWWAKGAGSAMELSKTLQPLAPFKKDMIVLNGLHLFDRTSGVHSPYFTNFFSGEKVRKTSVPDVAETTDHYMARTIGKQTPVPCLTLGIERTVHGIQGGLPSVYRCTLSWSSKNTPVPTEIYPRQAFDRLFDTSSLMKDKSVLDAVLGHARTVRGKLDYYDKQKLDEYMTSIRDIEHRIERATAEERIEGWQPTLDKPNIKRPPEGLPQIIPEHMKLMVDIMVLAFQMDKTRIATLLFNNDTSGMKFGFLDGVTNASMHGGISHHQNKKKTLDMYQRVNQFHVEMLVRALHKMKSIDEGGSTLLENTMLLFGSTMMDGDKHDADSGLPLILCGQGGGTLKTGRVLSYEKLEDRRLCNLHLALMQRMGMPDKEFGNSHYPLSDLS